MLLRNAALRLRNRLEAIEVEIDALTDGILFALLVREREVAARGGDLIAQMADALEQQIADAQDELDALGGAGAG